MLETKRLGSLVGYCEASECRSLALLSYFDDSAVQMLLVFGYPNVTFVIYCIKSIERHLFHRLHHLNVLWRHILW
ncbi:MAG: RecQ family zinc-binding domain-containing protein, partial [Paracoccaceae bacterium]